MQLARDAVTQRHMESVGEHLLQVGKNLIHTHLKDQALIFEYLYYIVLS